MLNRLYKPWFVHQPSQLVRRALSALSPPPAGYRELHTSWGLPITADPTRTIGRSILTTGVYDLAVTECLARLISPGDTVVDAGANIGYMSLLAAVAAGESGRVLSFEPHPDLFPILKANSEAARSRFRTAEFELHNAALGDQPGTANLVLPAGFGGNDGIAHIQQQQVAGERTVSVPVTTLDSVLAGRKVRVMKMDVEGFEAHVLKGATQALAAKNISHIVFEDHDIKNSEVVRILTAAGYQTFSLGWTMHGLAVAPVEQGSLAASYEAPNYIASIDVADMTARCQPTGWRTLHRRFAIRK